MDIPTKTFFSSAAGFVTAGAVVCLLPACSTVKSIFAVDQPTSRQVPIQNPFLGYNGNGGSGSKENIILRTKKGDRSIEVELPGGTADMTDFVIPVSPAFNEHGRSPASDDPSMDQSYREKPPSISDREITNNLPQGAADGEGKRREVEMGLGVMAAEDTVPASDHSYLAAMDHVKQMYKSARYEGALLETDELLRAYPTDPKIYEMRGTLLDRLGRTDLAIKSWTQAVRLDPTNTSLHRFVERKQQQRKVASPQ